MDTHFQTMGGRYHMFERPGSDIKKTGYLRKLKTMKKKFFVLRSTSSSGPARLEYFDSEKKFQAGNLPKRSIHLHTCFNINKKSDSRTGKFGIVLYTVQDSFAILTDSEEDHGTWLNLLLEYQNEYVPEGDLLKEHYEYVWQVFMQPRGLGQGKGVKGPYRLCLNSTTVSMFKVNTDQPQFTIQLVTIRSVAHHENSFCLAVGNYAATGPGEFWFNVDDTESAKDMHTTILRYMNSVKDFHHKDQQFGHVCQKRDSHNSLHDDFGGALQLHMDFRKPYSSRGEGPDNSGLDFINYSVCTQDPLDDLSPPLCPSDLDGEINSYLGFTSMMVHHGPQSTHSSSMHGHSYSELQHLTHLPTVKEGGSGEGFLLSENPSSFAGTSNFPRPEPATCLLLDDSAGLPPRTYSLGSKPTKKFQGFSDTSSRKGMGNEMSRATSAPHILKGRREQEHPAESPTPSASSLSMSLKSDDSDFLMEYIPMRPRTASDSYNCRTRTSSFSKLQQTCRPRSSSYGQGKRPVINVNRLNLEKAMMSRDNSQRTSRESSLQGSFESLHVSRESLRRNSQELKQSGGSASGNQADMRSTPSPQMRNMVLDTYGCIDYQGGAGTRKSSPHHARTDSISCVRSQDITTRGSDHQQSHSQHIDNYANIAPLNAAGGNSTGHCFKNVDYSTRQSDTKSVTTASQVSRQGNGNKKSNGSRSMSMENVDTHFINESVSKPRTGSWGSKDKQVFRLESARKSSPMLASTSSHSSSGAVPQHQQALPLPCTSGVAHQNPHPLASTSTRTFGSSDSIRKASRQASTEKYGMPEKDFRKKSGSTGSRPVLKKSTGITLGHHGAGVVPLRSPASRFSEDDHTYDYIEFTTAASRRDSHNPYGYFSNHHDQAGIPHSQTNTSYFGLPQSLTVSTQNGPFTLSEGVTSVHSSSTLSSEEETSYAALSLHAHHQQQRSHSPHSSPKSHLIKTSPSLPPSCSSQTTQSSIVVTPAYVPYNPRMGHYPAPAHLMSTKLTEFKNEYLIPNRGVMPFSSSVSGMSSTVQDLTLSKDPEEYVEYEPGITCISSDRPLAPSSSVSYIQKSEDSAGVVVTRLDQHHTSLSTNTSVNRPVCRMPHHCLYMASHSCQTCHSLNLGSTVSSAQSRMPPIPPLPSADATPHHTPTYHTPTSSRQANLDGNNYSIYNQDLSAVRITSSQNRASSVLAEIGCGTVTSPCTQLSLDMTLASLRYLDTDISNNQHEQLRQQTQSIQRQLSAPVCSSISANQPTLVLCELQQHLQSPTAQSSDKTCMTSSSSLSNNPSVDSGTSHLHLSRSLDTSKTCSRALPDSEGICQGNESSSTSSGSGRNNFQMPAVVTERRNLFSPSQSTEELLYDETNLSMTKSLEKNKITTKAKTRHSLGDIMNVMGIQSKKCCGNRVGGDCRSSGDLQGTVGHRSRHSIADIGSFQQTSSGLVSLHSMYNSTPAQGSRSIGGSSGDCESNDGAMIEFSKSLSSSDDQRDRAQLSPQSINENSSGTKQKSPSSSYSESDLVKSQTPKKIQDVDSNTEDSSYSA